MNFFLYVTFLFRLCSKPQSQDIFSRFFCGRESTSGSLIANHSYFSTNTIESNSSLVTKFYPFSPSTLFDIIFPSTYDYSDIEVILSLYNNGSPTIHKDVFRIPDNDSLVVSTSDLVLILLMVLYYL